MESEQAHTTTTEHLIDKKPRDIRKGDLSNDEQATFNALWSDILKKIAFPDEDGVDLDDDARWVRVAIVSGQVSNDFLYAIENELTEHFNLYKKNQRYDSRTQINVAEQDKDTTTEIWVTKIDIPNQ